MSDGDRFAVWGILAFIVVSLYLKFRTEVILGLAAIAVTIILAAMLSLVLMSRRRVVAPNLRMSAMLASLMLAFAVGILCVTFLWNPPVGKPLLAGMVSGTSSDKITGFFYVFYQIFGAAAFLALAVFCIAFCVALMSALNLHTGAAGQWLWKFLFRYSSPAWSGGSIVSGIILAAFTILFTGGWVFDWVSNAPSFQLPNTHTPTP